MNEKNLDYLKNSLKYLGFGDKLNDVLEKAIRQELPKFTITLNNTISPPGSAKEDTVERYFIRYDLSFSKSKESDMYFLNQYHAKLLKPHTPEREQIFTLNNGNWTTAKEAYNLLSGRSVNKDIPGKDADAGKVNVWTKFDLDVKDARGNYPVKYYYPNYGYDLDQALAKYPIPDLNDPEKKTNLINSTKKGDLALAELMLNGKKVAVFIAANPEMKGLDIYDKKMHPVKDYHIWPELVKDKSAKEQSSLEHVGKAERGNPKGKKTSSDVLAKPWEQDLSNTTNRSVGR